MQQPRRFASYSQPIRRLITPRHGARFRESFAHYNMPNRQDEINMPNRQDEAESFTSRNPWVPASPHDLREHYNKPTDIASAIHAKSSAPAIQRDVTYIEWYMDSTLSLRN